MARGANLSLLIIITACALAGCVVSRSDTSSTNYPAIEIAGQTYFIASLDAIDDLRDVTPLAEGAWPKEGQLTIALKLAQPKTGNYRRPYVAVWIEDKAGNPVRFLTVWGKQLKYQRDLRDMWQYFKLHDKAIDAVTGPTRAAGEYKLVWDGLDSAGKPMPAGDYTVHVEVAREHGTRVHMKKTIACGGAVKTDKLTGNVEVDGVALRFGPAKAQ